MTGVVALEGAKYAGFWARLVALVIDVMVVSVLVFPFALGVALWSSDLLLVEVPFGFFTTTQQTSSSVGSIEQHSDGSSTAIERYSEVDVVLGLWQNHYRVVVKKSDGEVVRERQLVDPDSGADREMTTSSDIELLVLVVYWILFEASAWQGSVGKRVVGIKVITERGAAPTLGEAVARNLFKMVSVFSLLIGFMMAGWTARKQTLHDKLAKTLVVKIASLADENPNVGMG